jgi:hypothetical protein
MCTGAREKGSNSIPSASYAMREESRVMREFFFFTATLPPCKLAKNGSKLSVVES